MTGFQKKINKLEILEVIEKIVEKNESDKNKILLTLNSLESHVYIHKRIEISQKTLRTRGINPQGIFTIKYPEVFDYHTEGRSTRGLIIDKEKFNEKKEEMKNFFSERLEV